MTMQNTTNKAHDGTIEGWNDGLLDKRGLAVRLDISKRTVDTWMRQKRLPFIKIGKMVRFRWPDVLEKLNAYRVN